MEISSIPSFLSYLEKTRQVTNKVLAVIPPEQLEWTYRPGKFTIGDLVRHIAAIERQVFAEIAVGRKPCYKGCGRNLADGLDATLAYFHAQHLESVVCFRTLPDAALAQPIRSLDGQEILLGNFLRALIVHEVHHRGALCIYLNMLGITTPPIIGLMEEQVIQLSK